MGCLIVNIHTCSVITVSKLSQHMLIQLCLIAMLQCQIIACPMYIDGLNCEMYPSVKNHQGDELVIH